MITSVRIQAQVPLSIFDGPILAQQVNKLFDGVEEKIKRRIDEIVEFLQVDFTSEFSYLKIVSAFKESFLASVLTEAAEMTFKGQKNYDFWLNILSLLSEEKLENAIVGDPMIDAFSNTIHNIYTEDVLSFLIIKAKLPSVKEKVLGKPIVSTFEKKATNMQNNHCGNYSCFCTCDGGCHGDTQHCTLDNNCSHDCNCYVGPMLKTLFPE